MNFFSFYINKAEKRKEKKETKLYRVGPHPQSLLPTGVTSSCTAQSKTYVSASFTGTAIIKAQRSTSRFFTLFQ